MSVFTLRRLAGTSSSSPDFCPLRFRGVSSYGSWFQSLLHLTWFQSPFSPADLAGSGADLSAPGALRPGPGRAQGSEEMRGEGGKLGRQVSFSRLSSPPPTSCLVSYLLFFSSQGYCHLFLYLVSSQLLSAYMVSSSLQFSLSLFPFLPPLIVSSRLVLLLLSFLYSRLSYSLLLSSLPL